MKMEECVSCMKNMVDQLALAVSPITTVDLVMYTLQGLDRDYNPIVVMLNQEGTLMDRPTIFSNGL